MKISISQCIFIFQVICNLYIVYFILKDNFTFKSFYNLSLLFINQIFKIKIPENRKHERKTTWQNDANCIAPQLKWLPILAHHV